MPASSAIRARLAALVLVAFVVTGCSATAPTEAVIDGSTGQLIAEHGLAGLDARDAIEKLEAIPVAERAKDLTASIRPDVLLLSTPDGDDVALPLPSEEFYLSIAPYVESNHDCHFHSLTTCLGELRGEEIEIVIVDASGATLISETRTTNDNGFTGVRLPRGLDAELTVRFEGRSGTTEVRTGEDDPTCLTTLQLT